METDEPGWRERLALALRPEPRLAPLSRRSITFDALLAIFLTLLAVLSAVRHGSDNGAVSAVPTPFGFKFRPEGSPDSFGRPLVVLLTAVPLALRRVFPLTVFWIVVVASLRLAHDATWVTIVCCMICTYTAIAYSRHRLPANLSLVVAAIGAGAQFGDAFPRLPNWSGPFLFVVSAGIAALALRYWKQRLGASQQRFLDLQQEQEAAMLRAVEVERARIASELHDVVTHNVSVMVVQAGAARKVMDATPAKSKEALLAVEASGRAAMAELRHVMGLLAPSSGEQAAADILEPQPGLSQLDSLVERVRAAGMRVSVAISTPPDPMPSGVDLAAYRVVQEALTNTLKHAVGAAASVGIGHDDEWLEIEVTDTGGDEGPQSRTGNGRGLIGLRERLAVYGGTLEAGRRIGGGYKVKARVPWRTP